MKDIFENKSGSEEILGPGLWPEYPKNAFLKSSSCLINFETLLRECNSVSCKVFTVLLKYD